MTPELAFATILISAMLAVFGFASGTILILTLNSYNDYIQRTFNAPLPTKILRRGTLIALMNIGVALFFVFRILYVLHFGQDVQIRTWFFYDTLVGVYLLCSSGFFYALYKTREKLDRERDLKCAACKRGIVKMTRTECGDA